MEVHHLLMITLDFISFDGRDGRHFPRQPVAGPSLPRWLGALAACLLALAAQANVFVEDRRQQQDATQPPWQSVGVLRDPDPAPAARPSWLAAAAW